MLLRDVMLKILLLSSVLFTACIDGSGSDDLVLDESTATSARGHLAREGVMIDFALATDGRSKTATITKPDGSPLLELAVAVDGSQTATLFGNRPGSDRTAQAELDALPEAALLDSLGDELVAAGVARDLMPAASHPTTAAFGGTPYVVSNPCGSWNDPGEGSSCGTNLFGTTSIYLENCSYQDRWVIFEGYDAYVPPKHNITLITGQTLTVCGTDDHTAHYYGARVSFANTSEGKIWFGH